MDKTIYILDSAVFIKNTSYLFVNKICVSSYLVYKELITFHSRIEFEKMQLQGMALYTPSKKVKEEIKKEFKTLKLSETDIDIIAIASELQKKNKNVTVVSDDYWIQNACLKLNIKYMSVERNEIKKQLKWKRYCNNCKKEVKENICNVCGSPTTWIPY